MACKLAKVLRDRVVVVYSHVPRRGGERQLGNDSSQAKAEYAFSGLRSD